MKTISFRIPAPLLEDLDSLIEKGIYPNRAETIRIGLRELIRNEIMLLSIKEKGDVNDN